jgi:PilZ domain
MAHFDHGLEHRWGDRVWVNIPVRVSTAAFERADGCVKNLSLSGALMRSDCTLRLHALIKVRIELPRPASLTAVLEAYVSRILNEGFGIEWCEFAPRVIKDLLRDPWVRSPQHA